MGRAEVPWHFGCLGVGCTTRVRSRSRHPPFTVYTANGQELQEIDLSQRNGIAAHLKMLRPELDPVGSLPALEESLDNFEEAPEVVVVTSPEALRDVNFRDRIATLARQNSGSYFVVTVARDGETCLNEITRSGCKPLQQLKFDLERVFANPPIGKAKPSSELPAIFAMKPFPLLLSYQFKPDRIWPLGTEMMMAISRDSRLMLSTGAKNGGFQLLSRVKQGKHWWSCREPIDSVWFSIIGAIQNNEFRLLCFKQEDWSVEEIKLELPERPIAFCNHGDTLFSIGKNYASIIDKSTGITSLNRLAIGGFIYLAGRYFAAGHAGDRQLYAVASDGFAPKFELLPMKSVFNSDCKLFDSTEVEGPVGVFDSGHMYSWATEKLIKIPHEINDSIRKYEISPTGNQVIARFQNRDRSYGVKIDVKTGELVKPPGHLADFHHLQIQKLVYQKSTRTQFLSIAIFDNGTLSLTSRSQSQLDISLTRDQVRLTRASESGNLHSRINFQSERLSVAAKFKLKVARWQDGSEAWLDSRGLLHLKSSDHEIPELTMALTDDAMGGWLSNGRVWGDSFYLQKSSSVHATNKYVMDVIKKFAINITSRC